MTRGTLIGLAAGLLLVSGCGTPAQPPPPPPDPRPAVDDDLARKVPEPVRSDGILSIGTDPSYPPMEFPADSGAGVQGVDVDLAGAIALVLDLSPQFKYDAYTALPTAVRTGRFELAAAGLSLRGDVLRTNDAVEYFRSGSQLVRSAGATGLTPSTMCGAAIAVREGSLQVEQLNRRSDLCRDNGQPPIRILARSDQDGVTALVLADRAAALLTDTPVAEYTIAQHPLRLAPAGRQFARTRFGMLTATEFRGLTRAVRGALQQLIDSGYYALLLERWQVSQGAVTRARIHWADTPRRDR